MKLGGLKDWKKGKFHTIGSSKTEHNFLCTCMGECFKYLMVSVLGVWILHFWKSCKYNTDEMDASKCWQCEIACIVNAQSQ